MGAGTGKKRRAHSTTTAPTSKEPPTLCGPDDDGYFKEIWLNEKGENHRDNDQPAHIVYDEEQDVNGKRNLRILEYYQNGRQHRSDGPARILYDEAGDLSIEVWCQNGKEHRDDGPARISYYPDGSIQIVQYFLHGRRHNEMGPAVISFNPDGSAKDARYYLNGREVTEHDVSTPPREWLKMNAKELQQVDF